jgi:predicted transcriptional regulator
MRKCNLSYRQLQAYLGLLLDKGFLEIESREEKNNSRKIFATTNKGRAFLKAYDNLEDALKKDRLKFCLGRVNKQSNPRGF